MRASLPLALLLFLFTAACAANGEATQRLVFDSQRDGDADIYTIAADGTGVRQLTDVPGRDYEPDAGPDGKTVVFASQRATGESAQLYLMDIDGSNVRRLTFSAGGSGTVLDDYPEWSPDGTRIVFQRTVIPEDKKHVYADIWLIDPKTGQETALTNTTNIWDSTPSFSADGKALLYESNRAGSFDIYRQPIDGGEAVRIAGSDGTDSDAKESPDGRRIAFVSDRDGDFEVYVVDPDGSNLRQLTSSEGKEDCPQWSPDGTRLSFSSDRDGDQELYVMNADGSDQRRLTNSPGGDEVADWITGD